MRLAAAALAVVALPAAAAPDDARWYVQVDNDVPFHTDRWYTSGVRIARVKDNIEWGLLQEIYTPEGKHWHPGLDDRAPAGRLVLSVARHDVSPEVFQTLELMAGVRGPSSHARETAEDIHQVIAAPFVDWSRQLEDAFDGTLVGVRSQRLGPLRVHYGAQLGTQVAFAHAGIEARFGPAGDNVGRLSSRAAWHCGESGSVRQPGMSVARPAPKTAIASRRDRRHSAPPARGVCRRSRMNA